MYYGSIFEDGYKPQFSGHETFPLRYGWLEKVYQEIEESQKSDNRGLFSDDEAIARFGVGKNMVVSMRHWAKEAKVIEENTDTKGWQVSKFGHFLFNKRHGIDKYLEHPSSLWALHWNLVSKPEKTTWFWMFNHFPGPDFERKIIVQRLMDLAEQRGWARVSETTVKRDVECFVRMYVSRRTDESMDEDSLESPLIELSLIRHLSRDSFQLVRGEKPSLGDGVFLYALIDFWRNAKAEARSLSFETLAHEPGSPGRVFLLDESGLADHLIRVGDISKGTIEWSETAGLRQILFKKSVSDEEHLAFLAMDYLQKRGEKVA